MKRKTLNLICVLSLLLGSAGWLISPPAALADGAGDGTWGTRASMPTARYHAGVVTANNGKIYAIGGAISSHAINTVEEYDPATNVWAARASMPTARWALGVAVASNGKIYAIGGWAGPGYPMLATVEEYDPATDTWMARTNMPTARQTMGVVAATNGKIYAIGGNDLSRDHATVEEYDPATDTWTTRASMHQARRYLGVAAASNGKIYAIGGADDSGSLATVEEYDPATDTWTTRIGMPTARQFPGVVAASNGKIYAIGGWDGNNLATAEEYDPATDTWVPRASMPTARYGLGVAATGNSKVYAIGGWNDNDLATVEEFSPPDILAAIPNSPEVYHGDIVNVDLEIQNPNQPFFALQATCTVSSTVLTPTDITLEDLFDPNSRYVAVNRVDAEAGTSEVAVSLLRPAEAISAGGPFATLTYVAKNPGNTTVTTSITCEVILSDRDGFVLPISFVGAEITVQPYGGIAGQATRQGRIDDHSGIAVTAAGPFTYITSTVETGDFAFTEVRAAPGQTTAVYTVTADAPSYLPTCKVVDVVLGATTALPLTILRGGDVNDHIKNDLVIDIGDAALVAEHFGEEVPPVAPPLEITQTDINADGVVNVQDLAILGGNYELAGCQPWQ